MEQWGFLVVSFIFFTASLCCALISIKERSALPPAIALLIAGGATFLAGVL